MPAHEVFVLDESTAVAYCAGQGLLPSEAEASARLLGGGVSNAVVKVESGETRLVLKQALGKLRVTEDWFADRNRIGIEAAALRSIGGWLPRHVPEVLHQDPSNYIIAIECAPEDALPWKTQLMNGVITLGTGAAAGTLLAQMHREAARDPVCPLQFGRTDAFDSLRVTPYYRTVAQVHPDLARRINSLIKCMPERAATLVHGDYSPKNILVDGERLILIDCEVCHWGDPAFDTGFLLNHLLLKAQYRPQWAEWYLECALTFNAVYMASGGLAQEEATLEHLGPLMLARVDGKSPVEYISGEAMRGRVRGVARDLILNVPDSLTEAYDRIRHAVAHYD